MSERYAELRKYDAAGRMADLSRIQVQVFSEVN